MSDQHKTLTGQRSSSTGHCLSGGPTFRPDALPAEAMVAEPRTERNPQSRCERVNLQTRRKQNLLDATPIIHFAKIDELKLVLSICDAFVAREVYRETVERGQGKPDATVIHDSVERGEVKVYDVLDRNLVRRFQRHPEIHMGEAETLAAAKELNAFAIVDEAEARAVAKAYGIRTRTGTLFLLFGLLALKRIEATECERILDELVESGLYIDSHTFIRAKQKIRSSGHRDLSTAHDKYLYGKGRK